MFQPQASSNQPPTCSAYPVPFPPNENYIGPYGQNARNMIPVQPTTPEQSQNHLYERKEFSSSNPPYGASLNYPSQVPASFIQHNQQYNSHKDAAVHNVSSMQSNDHFSPGMNLPTFSTPAPQHGFSTPSHYPSTSIQGPSIQYPFDSQSNEVPGFERLSLSDSVPNQCTLPSINASNYGRLDSFHSSPSTSNYNNPPTDLSCVNPTNAAPILQTNMSLGSHTNAPVPPHVGMSSSEEHMSTGLLKNMPSSVQMNVPSSAQQSRSFTSPMNMPNAFMPVSEANSFPPHAFNAPAYSQAQYSTNQLENPAAVQYRQSGNFNMPPQPPVPQMEGERMRNAHFPLPGQSSLNQFNSFTPYTQGAQNMPGFPPPNLLNKNNQCFSQHGSTDSRPSLYAEMPENLRDSPYRINQMPNPPVSSNYNQMGMPLQAASPGVMKSNIAPQPKINPEQLPNYVQLVNENRKKYEIFSTATSGPPPYVTTDVIYHDTGNCSPRFVRSTVYGVPISNDMVKQSQIPIALSVNPYADPAPQEEAIQLTSFVDTPLRCHRCKAYMCPFMQFIDGGKRFHCAFCETNTDVPAEYFSHIDYSGKRVDYLQRPELHSSSYEIVATNDYCKNKTWPKPASFIFILDVSYGSVRSGLLNLFCDKVKSEILPFLPKDKYQDPSKQSPVKVAFITFNSKLHFYSLKKSLLQPHVMIVSDVTDIFLPLLDGFFIDVQESEVILDSFFSHLKEMYANTQETEIALGPAIQAGINALMAADCPGKLYVFATAMPIGNAPGKLNNREDHKLLGTDKEKNILSPATNFYTKLGEECIAAGCSVDLFLFPNQYVDISTIGEVCRVAGGQIYYYRYFSADTDGEKFLTDLRQAISRPTAYDAVMRIRSSNGIRAVDFVGSFRMPNSTDMEFGTVDCDKTIFAEFKHDDKLPADSSVYFQVALLYTTLSGNRVIRIHNMFLPTVNTYAALFQSCEFETIISYMMKIGARSMTVSSYKSIKDNIIAQLANILNCYRSNSTGATNVSHLVLPETLKVLPLFVNSLLKCDALAGVHTVTVDLKSWLLHEICSMSIKSVIAYLYPRIISLLEITEDEDGKLCYNQVRCLYSALKSDSAYLLENGLTMTIWLGGDLDNSVVQQLFGVPSLSQLQPENMRSLPRLDNPLSRKVRLLMNMLNDERKLIMKINCVRQNDSLEAYFKNFLVEDSGVNGCAYSDFLFQIHREIRNLSNS